MTTMRTEALPYVPTVGDFVPGFEASTWQGIGASKSTSVGIIDQPHDQGAPCRPWQCPIPLSPGDFAVLIAEETEKVIRAAMMSWPIPGLRGWRTADGKRHNPARSGADCGRRSNEDGCTESPPKLTSRLFGDARRNQSCIEVR